MKVLFIYTDINVRGGALSYQFGLGMLSAMLKRHGHETALHYLYGRYNPEPLRAKLAECRPDLIAVSGVSPQYRYIRRLFNDLAPLPAFSIYGGVHPTLDPGCLQQLRGLDAVCVGEGEYPLLELVQALQDGKSPDGIPNLHIKKKDGSIIRNPTRPFHAALDELPFPDRALFDYQAIVDSEFQTALFMFSRGCPYNCTFCSNHALRCQQEGRYVRSRSVDSCLAEIEQVISRYRVRTLYFNDDCFTSDYDWWNEFCDKYPRTFKLPFQINERPEGLTDEVCQRLKAAGCERISIGIENGSEKFRAQVLGRRQPNERIVAAFDACRRAGIRTKSFNIVGFPFETPEIFQETVAINARINPDSCTIGIFEPYPGTRLAKVCEEQGWIDASRLNDDFVGRNDTVLNMPQFTRRQILKAFRNFTYNVYKHHSLKKAVALRIYYSRYGQICLKLLTPFRNLLRRSIMGV